MDEIIGNITLVGLVVGYFLAMVLIFNKTGPPGTRTLGLLMFLVASAISMQSLISRNVAIAVFFGFFLMPALFYHGPLTYFYTKKVLYRTRFTRSDYLRHAIPVLIMLIAHIVIHVVHWDEMNLADLRARAGPTRVMIPLILLMIEISAWAYAFVSYRSLRRYAGQAREHFAHDINAQIRWLRLFLLSQMIGLALHACIVTTSLFTPMGLPLNIFDALLLTGFMFFVVFYLIRQPSIFKLQEDQSAGTEIPAPPSPESAHSNEAPEPAAEKYRKQALDAAARRELLGRLEEFMRDDQPYLEDTINLNQVAARLDVPPHHVSMVINAELGQNFFTYVNQFRLEEVTHMLADPDLAEENVLSIAFRAGFRSKAAFNRVFKEHTNLSPRAYRLRALQRT